MAVPRMILWGVLAAILAVGFSTLGHAQAPASDEDKRITVNHPNYSDPSKLASWRDGRSAPETQFDQEILKRAAEWYIYRLTWVELQKRVPPDPLVPSVATSCQDMLEREFYPLLVLPDPRKSSYQPNENSVKYMTEFIKALIPPIQKVLKNPVAIARINAALVLLKLSESGQEQLAKPLADILADKDQIAPVKLLAVEALGYVFRGDISHDPANREMLDHGVRDLCIQSVLDYLTRDPQFTPETTQEEIDAYHYTRRKAIQAIGESRHPVVMERNRPKARTAYELFRIALDDSGVKPAPRLVERVAAIVALCQLQPKLEGSYQVDYALYLLGQAFVKIADQYESERLATVPAGQVPHPWKYYGALLSQAVQNLAEDPRARQTGADMLQISRNVFDKMAATEDSGVRKLQAYLKDHPVAPVPLYRNDNDSVLNPSAPKAPGS
jgi:hypothetical protein